MPKEIWDRHTARRRYVDHYLEGSLRLPKCSLMIEKGDYVLRSFREHFKNLPESSDRDGIKTRRVTITIEHGGACVGVLRATEWKIDPNRRDPLGFYQAANGESATYGAFAEQIFRCWNDDEWPAILGTLIQVDSLVIDTKKDSARGALAELGPFMDEEFCRRAGALVAQAFPMEFESDATFRSGRERDPSGFDQRRRAMLRHYSRTLKLRALPGESGEDGWMWRQYNAVLQPRNTPREYASQALDREMERRP